VNVATLAGLLRVRAALGRHDAWTRDGLLAYQAGALTALRAFAAARSPFHAELNRGLGKAPLHPDVFHAVLEALPVAGWQVIDEAGRLRVLLAQADAPIDVEAVGSSVGAVLELLGAHDVPILVELVGAFPRAGLGKAPLIRHEPALVAGQAD
jgi:hypothetical protein